MYEPKAEKRTIRDNVRDTFTPSRVGLLSWAFAAVFMGTVGLASYQFGTQPFASATARLFPSGLPLPATGDVETTASITRPLPIEVMRLREARRTAQSTDLEQGQIEVLQREIAGLRRRISALSEQNMSYSRRISDLEKQVARARLSKPDEEPAVEGDAAAPIPGVVTTEPQMKPKAKAEDPEISIPDATKTKASANEKTRPETTDPTAVTPPKAQPRFISVDRAPEYSTPEAAPAIDAGEPVRIVTLPNPTGTPTVTGSIPDQKQEIAAETFNSDPTRSTLEPRIITPSDPAGRVSGGADSQIKRSDFGAVIGHYRSTAGAAKAWADFKEQNEERMRDLRPLLLERTVPEGGISLLVGPFGNAADAAIACVHLLDVTELCHPALFAGDPLVTAAQFRDTAL